MGGCFSKQSARGPKGDFVAGKPAIQVKPAPEPVKTEQDDHLHEDQRTTATPNFQTQQQAREQPSGEQPLFRMQAASDQQGHQQQPRAMRIQRATPGQADQQGERVMMIRRSNDPAAPAADGEQGEEQECKVQ